MPAANSKLRNSWEQQLENWRASGLTGAAWCRQKEIAYAVFLYWRKKLESEALTAQSEEFIEIPEAPDRDWSHTRMSRCDGSFDQGF